MINFDLNALKRQEDSNEEDSGDENKLGLTEEVIKHHSDDEQEDRSKRYKEDASKHRYKKEADDHGKDQGSKQKKGYTVVYKKKDQEPYLYENEEKPYVSDDEKEDKGTEHKEKGGKMASDNKEKESDPTYIPRGAFYQHDTRGDDEENEETRRRRDNDRLSKKKWGHDKYEKEYISKDKNVKGAKKGPVVQYVPKTEGAEGVGANNNEGKAAYQQRDTKNGDYKNSRHQGYHQKYSKPKENTHFEGKDKEKDAYYSKKKGVVVEYVAKAPEKKK